MIKIKNIYLAFKDQLPLKRFFKNLFNGNLKGLFHIRSHQNHIGTPKVTYNTKATAEKAANQMAFKRGVHFSNYKCMYCDGYHLGKRYQDRDK